ncbi:hypothetical protein [Kitasatospora sp. MAA4]|uniref:hypothetical protein n=1 Tax=Kitasatospora sp. MAA4 TaxID=3035093 RepID=UPI0024762B13|nr:hypothetical protein [Kitasatospora sp. MAA4]
MAFASSYELAFGYADSGLTWADYLGKQPARTPEWAEAGGGRRAPGTVPFLPDTPSMAAVYSFGYTHASVNGKPVEKGGLDFYYKGPGSLLLADGDRLTGSSWLSGGGLEVEYCAIYCIDTAGEAVYLGYTLANDFSDAGLRTAHRNLANLSKLHPSVLSSEVILGDLPASSQVSASIERDGAVAWQRTGTLGRQAMIYPRRLLERLLLGPRNIFQPGMIVYLLLGTSISSHKDGFELRDADSITIQDHGAGLALRNDFFN